MDSPTRIDSEIAAAVACARSMISTYLELGDQIKTGETHNMLYSEILDFVNFRIETADTCLDLIERGKIADSLGLCRALMENYLLLKLLSRGTKYFQLQNFEELTESQFKKKFAEFKEQHAAQVAAGETKCIEVRIYPKAKRHLMYVFEGLNDESLEGFKIPIHYFHFRDFHPETMRLNEDDYFVYYEQPDDLKTALKGHQREAEYNYRHYLSYGALLVCLEINGLADKATQARIEAHYTFLGKFLHPTNDAARDLHDRSNVHSGGTHIGMGQTYSKAAVLLAAAYVCHLLADILDEVSELYEGAPELYVIEPGTAGIRQAAHSARERFPYFWFIYNEPTLHHKYNYAIHHATDEDLAASGGYAGLPADRIPFNQHIYAEFQAALGAWSNIRCGVYVSPIS